MFAHCGGEDRNCLPLYSRSISSYQKEILKLDFENHFKTATHKFLCIEFQQCSWWNHPLYFSSNAEYFPASCSVSVLYNIIAEAIKFVYWNILKHFKLFSGIGRWLTAKLLPRKLEDQSPDPKDSWKSWMGTIVILIPASYFWVVDLQNKLAC